MPKQFSKVQVCDATMINSSTSGRTKIHSIIIAKTDIFHDKKYEFEQNVIHYYPIHIPPKTNL